MVQYKGLTPITTSQINRAGRTLRAWMLNPTALRASPVEVAAWQLLLEYRARHSQPLIKANNGLRSMLRSEGCAVEVSQRLKRMSTILDKLVRQPTMALATMQDIAGCRAILNDIAELRRVEKRVAHRRPPIRVDDYVTDPRATGYRAVHLIVKYDDRCIEIQLRTRLMHEWAVAVERIGGRIDEDLKNGNGPQEVLDWLGAVSRALAIEDDGGIVGSAQIAEIDALRAGALPYLGGGS